MKTLHYATSIAASKNLVWHVLFDDEMFRQWANVFAEGSYFQGDWREGGTIRFLTPEGNGMVSVIAANRQHEFLSIKHLGCVNQGVDDVESDEANSWAPCFENYTLKKIPGGTELVIGIKINNSAQQSGSVIPLLCKPVLSLSKGRGEGRSSLG